MLERSLVSLLTTADDPTSIEILLAFDRDDQESSQHFVKHISPVIESFGAKYSAFIFEPMGYSGLNEYLNKLATYAKAPWWVFWNEDAVMLDSGWDTVISSQGDRFCIQAFDTHNRHPYSIFPIVPRAWFEQLGHLSFHPLNDAYISQIAWMLDIMVLIPIKVAHERFDLTGKNKDKTFEDRVIFEGNIHDPRDFNHVTHRQRRMTDANLLASYLQTIGHPSKHFAGVIAGTVDPWEHMLAADINNQVVKMPPTI